MARISGVDIPNAKRVEIGLCYIYGIGRKSASDILAATGVNPDIRVKDLEEDDVSKLRDYIDKNFGLNLRGGYGDWLSYEDVLRLKQVEEMVELYYNSNQFTHTLPLLEQLYDNPFYLFEALAEFYDKQGYFVKSPARSYRYQVLLAFAVRVDPGREALYRESLTYDLYLRENAKSRPEFAKDITPYKALFHRINPQQYHLI